MNSIGLIGVLNLGHLKRATSLEVALFANVFFCYAKREVWLKRIVVIQKLNNRGFLIELQLIFSNIFFSRIIV